MRCDQGEGLCNGQSRSRRRGGDEARRDGGESEGSGNYWCWFDEGYKLRGRQDEVRVGGKRRRLVSIGSRERLQLVQYANANETRQVHYEWP